ncbi:MAG: tyrosine-type recombinase/integrase [Methylobacterium sp.]|uniref:tyrosine-type recombinase/integrase n=1 Tax=Methylobacterium sp. TaxID=409 RepID=UPI0025E20E0E|nr:tyrosine-type recombinase/integrase [Methylobacterium sp.]MBX9933506.1 tyrosine-type recombinase/integrase [Methylobacterium sp.]
MADSELLPSKTAPPAPAETLPAVLPTSEKVSGWPESQDGTAPLPSSLRDLARAARAYAARKDSANTRRAYDSDWRQFARWCRRQGFAPDVPDPQTLGLYLTAAADGHGLAKAAVSTLERRLSAITTRYRSAGTPFDRGDRHIVDVMAGIRRTHGRPPRQKEAVLGDDVLAMVATLSNDLRGWRDRAILLLGFAGGLRRSEIVGLDCGPGQTEDSGGWAEILDAGALLTIRGKTGWRTVEVARGSSERTCPVAALETWLKLARIAHGPIFRRMHERNGAVAAERLSDKHVARLVKRTALAAGIRGDLAEGERRLAFAGHSLRAGLATAADVEEALVQRQLGHASADTTRGYKRRRERFRVNLTKASGL